MSDLTMLFLGMVVLGLLGAQLYTWHRSQKALASAFDEILAKAARTSLPPDPVDPIPPTPAGPISEDTIVKTTEAILLEMQARGQVVTIEAARAHALELLSQ